MREERREAKREKREGSREETRRHESQINYARREDGARELRRVVR